MRNDLLRQCRAAFSVGLAFPTVWQTILRVHPAVRDKPIAINDGERQWLEVPLVTGDHLIFEEPVGYWLIGSLDLLRRERIAAGDASDPEQARARRFRHKAEELRTAADGMASSAKGMLLRLAATYDVLADGADAAAD